MTELSQTQQQTLTNLLQQLLPAHNISIWTAETELLGSIPEFDSMMLVNLLGGLEDSFQITLDESQLSAESFASWGTLQQFVKQQLTTAQ